MIINNLDVDENIHQGILSKTAIHEILKLHATLGNFEHAVIQYSRQKNDYFLQAYTLDPRRAIGLRLLGDFRGKRVLDYGCETGLLGAIAVQLGANVTFVDRNYWNLKLAQLRCQDHNFHQVEFIACQDWELIGQVTEKFDIILLNGTLDKFFINVTKNSHSINEHKLSFLESVKKRLTSEGCLWITGFNRNSFPSIASSRYPKTKGWSLSQYQKLFQLTHLKITNNYAVFPNYYFPSLITCLDDLEGLHYGIKINDSLTSPRINQMISIFKNPVIKLVERMGKIQNIIDSYLFIAKPMSVK